MPIIVDREERPDIDNIYMNYIQAINGAGGWPLNVFLTPELEPVFGGTYWPSPGTELIGPDGEEVAEDERIDFLVILQKMKEVWPQHEARCRQEAKEIVSKLREFAAEGTLGTRGIATSGTVGASSAAVPTDTSGTPMAGDSDLDLDQLEEAYMHIAGTFDPVNGGFGIAPKFPTPAKLSFLLKLSNFPSVVADVVGDKEVAQAKHIALHTLRRLRDGGLRDHVGGGFHRYAVTADWSMPHFEKMVSDNALLLGLYLDAWLSTAKGLKKEDEFANVVFELAEYLTSPHILRPDGGFASSEAADSYYRKGDTQMREGAYYLWTRREFDEVFKDSPNMGALAAAHWNVLGHGNVEREQDPNDEFLNQNVLHTVKGADELWKQFGTSSSEAKEWIETARSRLRTRREADRVRPETDTKAVTSTNAMVISALARTSSAIKSVDPEKAKKYLNAARSAAKFIETHTWDAQAKLLYRSYFDKRSSAKGYAEDYAFLIEALLDLYEATGEENWLEWADGLQSKSVPLQLQNPQADICLPRTTNRALLRPNGAQHFAPSHADGAPFCVRRVLFHGRRGSTRHPPPQGWHGHRTTVHKRRVHVQPLPAGLRPRRRELRQGRPRDHQCFRGRGLTVPMAVHRAAQRRRHREAGRYSVALCSRRRLEEGGAQAHFLWASPGGPEELGLPQEGRREGEIVAVWQEKPGPGGSGGWILPV